MVGTKRSCPGTSTNATPAPDGSVVQAKPRSMRHAAPALLRPPVRLHPGQRPHQRRLAVVDVPGGGDDVHVSPQSRGCGQHRAAERGVVGLLDTQRRSSSSRPRSTRPSTAGSPVRSRSAYGAGRLTARARQLDPGRAAAADHRGRAVHRLGVHTGRPQQRGQPLGPLPQRRRVGRQRPRGRRGRAAQGRLQRGQGELVHPQRPGQRVPAQPLDHVGAAEQQPGLRAAEQLVAAGGDQRGAGPQRGRGVRLVRQQRVSGPSSPEPMSTTTGAGERRQLRGRHAGGEAGDHEVGRVHLEHEAGLRADRGGVVGQACRLVVPTSRSRAPVDTSRSGQPEAVADLDQLAPADHDLPAGGQRGRGQHQRGGAVVDHVHRLGGRHRGGQRRRARRARAGPAPAGGQVQLDVGGARRRRAPRPRAAADSGARPRLVCSTHAGRVEHRAQRGRHRGQVGQRRPRPPRPAPARRPGPAAGPRPTASRTSVRPSRPTAAVQARVGQHGVGTRHPPARVRLRFRGGHAVTVRPGAGRRPGRSATVRPAGPAPAADGLRPGART